MVFIIQPDADELGRAEQPGGLEPALTNADDVPASKLQRPESGGRATGKAVPPDYDSGVNEVTFQLADPTGDVVIGSAGAASISGQWGSLRVAYMGSPIYERDPAALPEPHESDLRHLTTAGAGEQDLTGAAMPTADTAHIHMPDTHGGGFTPIDAGTMDPITGVLTLHRMDNQATPSNGRDDDILAEINDNIDNSAESCFLPHAVTDGNLIYEQENNSTIYAETESGIILGDGGQNFFALEEDDFGGDSVIVDFFYDANGNGDKISFEEIFGGDRNINDLLHQGSFEIGEQRVFTAAADGTSIQAVFTDANTIALSIDHGTSHREITLHSTTQFYTGDTPSTPDEATSVLLHILSTTS